MVESLNHSVWFAVLSIVRKKEEVNRMPHEDEKIVVIGGGTGLRNLLKWLKRTRKNITAVCTVADDGGHSGVLRFEHGVLPPGDFRQVLLAMAEEPIHPALETMLSFRFPHSDSDSTNNVSSGNIGLTALFLEYGPVRGLELISDLLRIKGKVLPVSLDDIYFRIHTLMPALAGAKTYMSQYIGEYNLDKHAVDGSWRPVYKVEYVDRDGRSVVPRLYRGVRDEILAADKIVFAPTSFHGSRAACLAVQGMAEALTESNAQVIDIINLMTVPNDTNAWPASLFVKHVLHYIAPRHIDVVVCNVGEIPPMILEGYTQDNSRPVDPDPEKLDWLVREGQVRKIVYEDLVEVEGKVLRNGEKTAKLIASL